MIDHRIFKVTDFEWEISFKYSFDNLAKSLKTLGPVSRFHEKPKDHLLKKMDHKDVSIKFDMFSY